MSPNASISESHFAGRERARAANAGSWARRASFGLDTSSHRVTDDLTTVVRKC